MRDACISAVEAELKRPLKVAEARDIEARVNNAIVQGQKKDPQAWRGLTRDERIIEGGKRAAQELLIEEAVKKKRVGEAIMLKAFNERYLADQVASGADQVRLDALQRLLVAKYDGKNNAIPVESEANGYYGQALGAMVDVFEAVRPGLWHFLAWENTDIRRQMRLALAHQTSFVDARGQTRQIEPVFISAAKVWHDTTNSYREVFNAAGGIIGKLENWDQPHAWSRRLANKYGQDAFIEDMMGANGAGGFLDRTQYVHENGSLWDDADMIEFLKEAWLTIATDGRSKDPSPQLGGGAKANRHSRHRAIHLRPEMVDDALSKYSESGVLQAMTDHLRQMSRDIALVQRFGPNADHQFKALVGEALQEAVRLNSAKTGKYEHKANYLQRLYDHLAGNEPLPDAQALADAAAIYRSTKTASALGSAIITSITDFATLWSIAAQNHLNPVSIALNSALLWSPKSRRYIKRMGLMVDAVQGYAARWGSENLTARDMASRVASASIGASGLNFVTEARRAGFSMTMMDAVGSLTRRYQNVSRLAQGDQRILASKGIDQRTWDIWRAAKLDKWGANHTLLTPDAIMAIADPQYTENAKRRAIAALLGIVNEEQDLAIITPGARERVQMVAGTERGTWLGEIARSGLLFKSFPWAYFQRHWEAAQREPSGLRKYYYRGALLVMMTMFGMTAQEIADILNGKNPRSINPANKYGVRNLTTGFMKGGAFGVYGDFLFSEISPWSNNSLAETLAGPLISDASKVGQIGSQLVVAGFDEEKRDDNLRKAGANTVRFGRGLTPGANMWYSKAVTDRYVFNALTEAIDPDYLDEMQARQSSQQGTSYWWDTTSQPGLDGSEPIAPDFGAAFAED